MEFKPGAYQKGDIVTVNGVQYVADRDILNASAIPKDNMYWTKVETQPEPTPIPTTTGLSPTNTPEQNSLAIEAILAAIPEGHSKSIYIPTGDYYFARMIHIYRRPIYLHGDNGSAWSKGTRFFFPYNTDGIFIDRAGQSIQETIIKRIFLQSAGGDGSNGSGIRTNSRVKIYDVTCKNFSRNGFDIWANMEEGGDASGSLLSGCHALENKLDGFFAGRVDANVITFFNCDARDNGRMGFLDDSFLGNNYISCMAHYNKGGDFWVRDWGNARSGFQFCYTEGGNVISSLGPKSTVVGGLWGSGYNKNDGKGIIYT